MSPPQKYHPWVTSSKIAVYTHTESLSLCILTTIHNFPLCLLVYCLSPLSTPDLPDPGIELGSPTLHENSLPVELSGKRYPKLNGIEILKWVSGNQGYRFSVKGCFSPCLSLVVRQCMPPASPALEWHDRRHHMKENFSIQLADMVLVLYSHFPGHTT